MGSEDIYGNISRRYESMAEAAKKNHEADLQRLERELDIRRDTAEHILKLQCRIAELGGEVPPL